MAEALHMPMLDRRCLRAGPERRRRAGCESAALLETGSPLPVDAGSAGPERKARQSRGSWAKALHNRPGGNGEPETARTDAGTSGSWWKRQLPFSFWAPRAREPHHFGESGDFMGKHVAIVDWSLGDGSFADGRYSRTHTLRFDGGAEVAGSSSPSVVSLPWSDPAGVDPEEALIASASACHMLWFLHIARDAGFMVTRYRDEAEGVMAKDGDGRIAITRIVLRPDITFSGDAPSAEVLGNLHHRAHDACFIANSLKSEIVVEQPA